jgi:hypothetical protein
MSCVWIDPQQVEAITIGINETVWKECIEKQAESETDEID